MSVMLYWKNSFSKVMCNLSQNRRYLNYVAVGVGTLCVSQCQKLHSKNRFFPPVENKIKQKTPAKEDTHLDKTSAKQKIDTKFGSERTVEDLVHESTSNEQLFKDSSNYVKSVSTYQNKNPFVWDSGTPKTHDAPYDATFTIDWTVPQKQIIDDIKQLRHGLSAERSHLGSFPLSLEETVEWQYIISKYKKLTEEINKKIELFNFIVPVTHEQITKVDLDKEAKKILINGLHSQYRQSSRADALGTVLSVFEDILFGRWKKYTS